MSIILDPSAPAPTALTGLAVVGDALVPTSAAHKRIYHAARGYRYSDAAVTVKHRMETAVPGLGYAVGAIARRLDEDNYLVAQVTSAALTIRKSDGGVLSDLAAPVAIAALAAGTDYWVRLICDGVSLRAEHWTTEPTPMGIPAAVATHTLAGADAGKFVAEGEAGVWWEPGPDVVPTINHVTNPSGETNLTTWSGSHSAGIISGSAVRSSAWAYRGSWSFLVTGTNANDSVIRIVSIAHTGGTAGIPLAGWAAEGDEIVLSCRVKTVNQSVSRGYTLRLTWYTSGGASISTITSADIVDEGADGLRLEQSFTVPATAAFAQPKIGMWTSTPNDVVSFHVDAIQLEVGAVASPDFDGDALGYEWEGTAHASRSVFIPQTHLNARITGFRSEPFTYRARTLPDTIALGGTIPGTAPALADIEITSANPGTPTFALFGWNRNATGGSTNYPFGVIDSSAMGVQDLTTTTDALARGGNLLTFDTSLDDQKTPYVYLDYTALTEMDAFAPDEMDVEIWARVRVASTVLAPRLTPYQTPEWTSGPIYTEWGAEGKLLPVPSSGSQYRFARVGTITVSKRTGGRHVMWPQLSCGAGSTGLLGLDYLFLVPAKRRAASPTGKAGGGSYPTFLDSPTDQTRIIASNLEGFVQRSQDLRLGAYRSSGLGGSPIELSPAAAPARQDLAVKLSDLVPDDPTVSAATEQLSHQATVHVAVTPRSFVARG